MIMPSFMNAISSLASATHHALWQIFKTIVLKPFEPLIYIPTLPAAPYIVKLQETEAWNVYNIIVKVLHPPMPPTIDAPPTGSAIQLVTPISRAGPQPMSTLWDKVPSHSYSDCILMLFIVASFALCLYLLKCASRYRTHNHALRAVFPRAPITANTSIDNHVHWSLQDSEAMSGQAVFDSTVASYILHAKEHKAKIKTLEVELENRDALIEFMQSELNSRDATAKNLQVELDINEAANNALDAALEVRDADIRELKNDLDFRVVESKSLEDFAAVRETHINKLDGDIEKLDDERDGLFGKLATSRCEFDRVEADLKARDREVSVFRDELKSRNVEVEELEAKLKALEKVDKELQGLQGAFNGSRTHIQELTATITKANDEMETLNDSNAAADMENEQLKVDLAVAEKKIEQLTADVAEDEKEIERLQNEVDQNALKAEKLTKTIDEFSQHQCSHRSEVVDLNPEIGELVKHQWWHTSSSEPDPIPRRQWSDETDSEFEFDAAAIPEFKVGTPTIPDPSEPAEHIDNEYVAPPHYAPEPRAPPGMEAPILSVASVRDIASVAPPVPVIIESSVPSAPVGMGGSRYASTTSTATAPVELPAAHVIVPQAVPAARAPAAALLKTITLADDFDATPAMSQAIRAARFEVTNPGLANTPVASPRAAAAAMSIPDAQPVAAQTAEASGFGATNSGLVKTATPQHRARPAVTPVATPTTLVAGPSSAIAAPGPLSFAAAVAHGPPPARPPPRGPAAQAVGTHTARPPPTTQTTPSAVASPSRPPLTTSPHRPPIAHNTDTPRNKADFLCTYCAARGSHERNFCNQLKHDIMAQNGLAVGVKTNFCKYCGEVGHYAFFCDVKTSDRLRGVQKGSRNYFGGR